MFAVAGIPVAGPAVRAQQWNLYSNASSSFYVPFVSGESRGGEYNPLLKYVNLTLNNGNSGTPITTPFTMDTGSLGIVASSAYYKPSSSDTLLGSGTLTYTSDQSSPSGLVYLTTVTINGQNGQTATARVPVLAANNADGYAQLGIGFAREGMQITGTNGQAYIPPNLNPFLGLTSINGLPVGTMNPGYVISTVGFGGSYGPGVMLGLTQANSSGFAFVQLTPSGLPLPAGCSTAGMNCPINWNPQTAVVSVGERNLGTLSMLPDSGLGYMLIAIPNGGIPANESNCSGAATNVPGPCLASGTQVVLALPGQTTAAQYSFYVYGTPAGNPQPAGVRILQRDLASQIPSINTGVSFFSGFDYLYDPINGFVGYMPNSTAGSNVLFVPLLALQGTLAPQNGFYTNLLTYLMGATTLQQSGSGTFANSILGPGSLTLQSGNVTLAAANSYSGGTFVNGGTLTIGSGGSIVGDLTVNAGGSFVNNGTVNTPNAWQLNQGSFTNNSSFLGNLANTGMATNTGTLTGGVINGSSGWFTNNGTVTGNFNNMGLLSGTGAIGGSLTNNGIVAPGNSIGTMTVSGNYSQGSGSVYATEVVGSGQSDRINVGGTATLGGQVFVSALPGMAFAPSTTYTILNATGGLSGTFAAVNELYPFLQSSLGYDANNVYLTLQVGGFAAQALNNTQYAVGAVLDANVNNATGDFATVLGTLATATAPQGQAVMTALSGNNYAGFSTSMVQGMQLFMNNFANQSGGGGSPMSNRVALAEACDVACDATTPPKWGAWGSALGGLGTIGAGQPVGTVTYNAGGFAAGLDRLVTDTFRMGVTAGYSTGTQWVGGFDGLGRSNTFQVGLYGGFAQDKVYADGVIGYAYTQNQMWRNIAVPGLQPRTAYGQTGANQWYGQLETGYRFDIGTNANAFVTPFARLQAYTANQNAFTETGAQSLNLSVAQQTTNSLRSVIGAQLGGSMDLGWREKLAMQLRLGWSHEYADVGRPVTATLAGAPAMPFTTWGVSPQRDGVVIGLSANTAVAEATSVYLRYEGDVSAQDSAHAITAGVRMTW